MTNKHKVALKSLKELLLINDYSILIDLFTNGRISTAPWITCPVNMIDKLPLRQKVLLQLFHLGEWAESVNEVMSEDILSALEEMGIIERHDNRWKTCNYVIFPYNGLFIIGQKWKPGELSKFDQVWLGEDSLCLARLHPFIKGKKVLDLCAGTGIQGMVLASRGADVTSIEINPEAVKVFNWNSIINNLEDNIRVLEGDLYKPVVGKKFDLIISNPPYIPLIEDEKSGLLFGSAGDDGLKIFKSIVYNAHNYLEPSGKMVIIAGGFGDNKKPFITEELTNYASKEAMDINLIVYGKKKAKEELDHIEKALPTVHNCYSRISEDMGIDNMQYYHFILTVNNAVEGKGSYNTIFCFTSLRDTFRNLKEGLKV